MQYLLNYKLWGWDLVSCFNNSWLGYSRIHVLSLETIMSTMMERPLVLLPTLHLTNYWAWPKNPHVKMKEYIYIYIFFKSIFPQHFFEAFFLCIVFANFRNYCLYNIKLWSVLDLNHGINIVHVIKNIL